MRQMAPTVWALNTSSSASGWRSAQPWSLWVVCVTTSRTPRPRNFCRSAPVRGDTSACSWSSRTSA
jgi:hypothetical protein